MDLQDEKNKPQTVAHRPEGGQQREGTPCLYVNRADCRFGTQCLACVPFFILQIL
jgi:hypothetical protein